MRPLEILLSFFILMIRLLGTPRMRYSALLALLIACAFTTDNIMIRHSKRQIAGLLLGDIDKILYILPKKLSSTSIPANTLFSAI